MRVVALFASAVLALAALTQTAGAQNVQKIASGRRAWLALNCYGCHGMNAAGGMGPNIQGDEEGDVASAMYGDATEGGMRDFSKYAKPSEPANIAAYLQSIGTRYEPTWVDWWTRAP